MRRPRVRNKKRKNPALVAHQSLERPRHAAATVVPDGFLFCVFCGGSHPAPDYDTNEAGETIMVQREMCVEGKRALIGLAFSQFIQIIINEFVK
jgi:hypothetical protein